MVAREEKKRSYVPISQKLFLKRIMKGMLISDIGRLPNKAENFLIRIST